MVESTRDILHGNGTRTCSTERRDYISSLPANVALLGKTVRAHWGIEHIMHWVLDVAFREGDCRIRCSDAAQNFAILRRIALNLLKDYTKTKLGIVNKRLKNGWDVSYLSRLLGAPKGANTLVAELVPAKCYSLYQEQIRFSIKGGNSGSITAVRMPTGEMNTDLIFWQDENLQEGRSGRLALHRAWPLPTRGVMKSWRLLSADRENSKT